MVAGDSSEHTVSLWNAAIRFRTVAVLVTDRNTGEEVLDTTFEVPIDAAVDVVLHDPSAYYVTIRVWKIGVGEVLRVPEALFDCEDSATQIGIFDSGDVRSVLSATATCDVFPSE